MTLLDLKNKIDSQLRIMPRAAEAEIRILIKVPGSIGPEPTVRVKDAWLGIDWNANQFLIRPEVELIKAALPKELFEEHPMSPPKDTIFWADALFNGKTSEQIFQEDLASGKYHFAGKKKEIRKNRVPIEMIAFDRPTKTKLVKVELVEYDVYEGDGKITCLRNPVVLQTWKPEEWSDKLEKRVRKEHGIGLRQAT